MKPSHGIAAVVLADATVAHRFRAGRLVAGSLAVVGLLTLVIWNAPLFTTSVRSRCRARGT